MGAKGGSERKREDMLAGVDGEGGGESFCGSDGSTHEETEGAGEDGFDEARMGRVAEEIEEESAWDVLVI